MHCAACGVILFAQHDDGSPKPNVGAWLLVRGVVSYRGVSPPPFGTEGRTPEEGKLFLCARADCVAFFFDRLVPVFRTREEFVADLDAIDDFFGLEATFAPPQPKLTRNAARCRLCNTVVESKYQHDMCLCACGAISVGGGLLYVKRGWPADPPGAGFTPPEEVFEELSEYETPKEAT